MDLPTYTSIWRIEKRLYKLYDFRLPMPVPVGQIAVFTAITVPYVILLTVLGLPFNHTLFWLYVLPPAVLTWLATRPVLESKRLPELVLSQVRYLGEPGTWCRMNPLAEKDDVVVVGKVWRRAEQPEPAPAPAPRPARQPAPAPSSTRRPAPARTAARAARGAPQAPVARPAAFGQPRPAGRTAARPPVAPGAPERTQRRVRVPESTRAARQVWEQARVKAAPPAAPAESAQRSWPGPASAAAPPAAAGAVAPPVRRAPSEPAPAQPASRPPEIAHDSQRAEPRPAAAPRAPARPRWPAASPGPTRGEAALPPAGTGRARGAAIPAGMAAASEATAAPAEGTAAASEGTAAPAGAPPAGAMSAGLAPHGPVPAPRVPDPKPSWFRSLSRRPVPEAPATPPPASRPSGTRPGGQDSVPGTERPAAPEACRPAVPLAPGPREPGRATPGRDGPVLDRPVPDGPVPDRPAPAPDAKAPAEAALAPPPGASAGGLPARVEDALALAGDAMARVENGPAPAGDAAPRVEDAPAPAGDATVRVEDAPAPPGADQGPVPAASGLAGFAPGSGQDTSDEADPAGAPAPSAAAAAPPGDGPAEGENRPADLAAAALAPLPAVPARGEDPPAQAEAAPVTALAPPSAEDLPAEDLPAEDLPAEDLSAEDPPAEDLSAEDPPAEDPPAGEAPAEGTPAGVWPVATPERPAAEPPGPARRTSPVVVVRGGSPRPTLVERAIGGPGQHRGGTGWREHVRVVPGGHGPGRPDMEQRDRARALLPIPEPRLAVMLGCTVGAGQTVTALMVAEVLASLRSEPVATLDLNPGQASLASLTDAVPAATVRSLLAGPATSLRPGLRRGHPDLIAHDTAASGEGLSDPDYARLVQILSSRYPVTLADPGPAAVARLLAAADQLVLVAPASSEAARAVAMTMEWLDGHGYAELCARSIAVINGVSKRSMSSAEQAEQIIRGRSHAILRIPWDDHLAGVAPGPGPRNGRLPGGPAAHFSQLRPPVQDAYTALAGVLVSALTNAERAVGGEQRRVSQ